MPKRQPSSDQDQESSAGRPRKKAQPEDEPIRSSPYEGPSSGQASAIPDYMSDFISSGPSKRREYKDSDFDPTPQSMSSLGKHWFASYQPETPDTTTQPETSSGVQPVGSCARCYILGQSCSRVENLKAGHVPKNCRRCAAEKTNCTDDHKEAEQIYGPPDKPRQRFTKSACVRCSIEGWTCSSSKQYPCRLCWKSRVRCLADRVAWEEERLDNVPDTLPPNVQGRPFKRGHPCARCSVMGAERVGDPPCERCWFEKIECSQDMEAAQQTYGSDHGDIGKTFEGPCEDCAKENVKCSVYHWPCLTCWKTGRNCIIEE